MRFTVGFYNFLLLFARMSSAVTTVNTICNIHIYITCKLAVWYREMRHVTSLGRFTVDEFHWDEYQRE
jgi:hypothetical protein